MDFALSTEEQELQAGARAFAAVIAEDSMERDATHEFPRALLQEAARLGYWGLGIPKQFGGLGLNMLEQCLVLEEFARADASLHVTLSVHNSLACGPIIRWGSLAQQQEWLPNMAAGHTLGAYALTEPSSGSDAAALRTRATRDGSGWLVNGTKLWITTGVSAETFIVFARTNPELPKTKGISAFIVSGDAAGFTRGKPENKLGIRSSETVQLFFEDVRLPIDALLGEENSGFSYAMATLDGGRIGIATQAVGLAQAALDAAVATLKVHASAKGCAFTSQQADFTLADMAVRTTAARLLVWRAARLRDAGQPHTPEASMAKLFASEAANKNCRDAVALLGGAAYTGGLAERLLRDARVTEIYEGTSEVQRMLVARSLRGS
ncbi:MAG: acyl-CoA dehydrogenase [Planctomycetes bacterium]|nr:acyl-CoA dehydrogenase [Planctomycetota bacterium]